MHNLKGVTLVPYLSSSIGVRFSYIIFVENFLKQAKLCKICCLKIAMYKYSHTIGIDAHPVFEYGHD